MLAPTLPSPPSSIPQPASMTGWTHKGTAVTESFVDRQGTSIALDETYRSWTLKILQNTGKGTLGISGVDGSGRDAMIYNGPCDPGQEIAVGMEYRNVQIAVILVGEDPPEERRWKI